MVNLRRCRRIYWTWKTEGSTDSGRGGSEIHFGSLTNQENILSYSFEIPQRFVGLLIGRHGKNVQFIKKETNADVLVKRHPNSNQNKICMLSGTREEIRAALQIIRDKFPLDRFPAVTLSEISFFPTLPCPPYLMLKLPEGSSFDVMLSATISAGHFFLQQPTHPTFHSLVGLTYQMTYQYNNYSTAPPLPKIEKGFICAATIGNCWYRAVIDEVYSETSQCEVRYLDYGGYHILPFSNLRQINYDFMVVPFQATECYLGFVSPLEGETGWSSEATAAFEELAQGQILQGVIVAYAEDGVPFVHLYRITGADHIDINMELANRGLVRYIRPDAPMPDALTPDALTPNALRLDALTLDERTSDELRLEALTLDERMPEAPMLDAPASESPMPEAPMPEATSDVPTPDTPMPEAPTSDVPTPDTPMPDSSKPDSSKPDSSKPDSSKPDSSMPGAPMPDAPTPDAPKPNAPA